MLKIRHSKAGRFIGNFFLWPRWVFGSACFYRFLIKIILGWHYAVQLGGYSSIGGSVPNFLLFVLFNVMKHTSSNWPLEPFLRTQFSGIVQAPPPAIPRTFHLP